MEKVKIVIIGTSKMGGGHLRMMALKDFLQSKNHHVDLIQFPGESWASKIQYYHERARARLHGHEKQHMKETADRLEKRIKKENYDVAIGVETPFSYVLTRELGCLKIFSCETLEADELYFSKRFSDLDRIRSLREMELEILVKSDYVIFPWETTENYVRKYILNGDNFVTIKFGCYPQNKSASYFFPVSLVSLGNLGAYWANKELLSYLTRISPYVIHVYGRNKPPREYCLNYKGFALSPDILCNYQFGLNTVSKGIFRLHASRILSYLSYGLPTLSPDWMEFSHELKGVLPYNEDNFLDTLEEYSDRSKWERLSKEAHTQACELDWRVTLRPLEKLIEK
jgi:hypothetical protein